MSHFILARGEAARWFERAAIKGDLDGRFYLAQNLLLGQGTHQDARRAAWELEDLVRLGVREAGSHLGFLYLNGGAGLPIDKQRAFQLFSEAASAGISESQYNLGVMYEDGNGIDVDELAARKWFEKAAERGYPAALHRIAAMIDQGRAGYVESAEEAFQWFLRAAEMGFADAQFMVGLRLVHGKGVAKDFSRAAQWFSQAALQDDAQAQYNLGILLLGGLGVDKNTDAGIEFITHAAEHGNEEAIIFLRTNAKKRNS